VTIEVSRVKTPEEQLAIPKGLSIFDPLLQHEVKEELESGGEVYVSRDAQGNTNGLFIYDECEATGTIFTKSNEVFDTFYKLKSSSYIFSELEVVEIPNEVWNIWQLDVEKAQLGHRFKYQVSMDHNVPEIENFMADTSPETNMKWISVALRNGDKCFVVKMQNRIIGIAWLSIAGDVARSHSIYVEPRFRRMGIMSDIFEARLIYLKSRRVRTLINEVADSNVESSSHVAKVGEKIVGKLFLYTSPDQ